METPCMKNQTTDAPFRCPKYRGPKWMNLHLLNPVFLLFFYYSDKKDHMALGLCR